MSDAQLPLFGDETVSSRVEGPSGPLEDAAARRFATDPTNNVVLEASAGTGKTTVLVARYVNLLRAGVDPAHILAITFTRQAAAEMRERIIRELRRSAARSAADRQRWRDLRDRLAEITISTIDAFCLSLLREFPLEADLDPAFGMADETEVPRLVQQALDRTLAVCGRLAGEDVNVAMVLAHLGTGRVRTGLAHLLERRLVAPAALQRFLAAGPAELTAERACRTAAVRLADQIGRVEGGLGRFLADGPLEDPSFELLARELPELGRLADTDPDALRPLLDRIREYFLTREGRPRRQFTGAGRCRSRAAWRRHRAAALALAPGVADVLEAFDRDLNVLMARGARRMFAVAVSEYERELASRSVLDFSDVLQRALDLLGRMDEFAQSRFRLESRYHHVLVDEFQDTSRAQWELVSKLIQSWGEGFGLVHDAPVPPSVFVVGDRKQSIYGFRDADVAVLGDAAAYIETLRPAADVRRSITHSFRAVPGLLAFVNDLFGEVEKADRPKDGFRYDRSDRFPVPPGPGPADEGAPLGLVLGASVEECADRVAAEVVRLLDGGQIRDRTTGIRRAAAPGDVAILFRSRETHREFQAALERRGVPAIVYKGLGFFDADEIKDFRALLRFLADPTSELRAAALLRSRFVGVSDATLAALAGRLCPTLLSATPPEGLEGLDDVDRRLLERLRAAAGGWLAEADRVPPAQLLDRILGETAYAFELQGPRNVQARENLKKMRGLVRRVQNRGFATLARLSDHIDRLSGDISNAVVDAFDAVNLMTVHAAKGLEFPLVFLVELTRGTGGVPSPIRLVADRGDGRPSVSVGTYRAAADDDRRSRDREETKRLLYVATTRARDRLYLSATRDGGSITPGPGSLAVVLPPSLVETLGGASPDPGEGGTVDWQAPGGRLHRFALVGAAEARRHSPPAAPGGATGDRLEPWEPRGGLPRVPVTAPAVEEPERGGEGGRIDPVTGRLVHRLLQHDALRAPGAEGAPTGDDVLALMTPAERARPDCSTLAADAAAIYARARRSEEVVDLLRAECLFEVPFSMRRPASVTEGEAIVRGVIDWLCRWPDGRVTVVELKTGHPRPAHDRQLATYLAAARGLFPTATVEGRLLYV